MTTLLFQGPIGFDTDDGRGVPVEVLDGARFVAIARDGSGNTQITYLDADNAEQVFVIEHSGAEITAGIPDPQDSAGNDGDQYIQHDASRQVQSVWLKVGGSWVEYGLPTGTGSVSETRVQELINATSLSALQGEVADAQIPAAIMRDDEFTAAAVRGLLGLTADEVTNLLVGQPIAGSVLTFTLNDGTSQSITVNTGGGGGTADGVVTAGEFNADRTELTLTVDGATDVVIDVPAALRRGGSLATLNADGSLPSAADNQGKYAPTPGGWVQSQQHVIAAATERMVGWGDYADFDNTFRGVITTTFFVPQNSSTYYLVNQNGYHWVHTDSSGAFNSGYADGMPIPSGYRDGNHYRTEAQAEPHVRAIGDVFYISAIDTVRRATAYVPAADAELEWYWAPVGVTLADVQGAVEDGVAEVRAGVAASLDTLAEVAAALAGKADTDLGNVTDNPGLTQDEVIYVPAVNVGFISAPNHISLSGAIIPDPIPSGSVFAFEVEDPNTGSVQIRINGADYTVQKANSLIVAPRLRNLEANDWPSDEPVMVLFYENALYWVGTTIGTAAKYNVGTAEGRLAVLGSGGRFPASLLPQLSEEQIADEADTDFGAISGQRFRHGMTEGLPEIPVHLDGNMHGHPYDASNPLGPNLVPFTSDDHFSIKYFTTTPPGLDTESRTAKGILAETGDDAIRITDLECEAVFASSHNYRAFVAIVPDNAVDAIGAVSLSSTRLSFDSGDLATRTFHFSALGVEVPANTRYIHGLMRDSGNLWVANNPAASGSPDESAATASDDVDFIVGIHMTNGTLTAGRTFDRRTDSNPIGNFKVYYHKTITALNEQATVQVQDEGTLVPTDNADDNVDAFNFEGDGVSVAVSGAVATVTIPGGGGGGSAAEELYWTGDAVLEAGGFTAAGNWYERTMSRALTGADADRYLRVEILQNDAAAAPAGDATDSFYSGGFDFRVGELLQFTPIAQTDTGINQFVTGIAVSDDNVFAGNARSHFFVARSDHADGNRILIRRRGGDDSANWKMRITLMPSGGGVTSGEQSATDGLASVGNGHTQVILWQRAEMEPADPPPVYATDGGFLSDIGSWHLTATAADAAGDTGHPLWAAYGGTDLLSNGTVSNRQWTKRAVYDQRYSDDGGQTYDALSTDDDLTHVSVLGPDGIWSPGIALQDGTGGWRELIFIERAYPGSDADQAIQFDLDAPTDLSNDSEILLLMELYSAYSNLQRQQVTSRDAVVLYRPVGLNWQFSSNDDDDLQGGILKLEMDDREGASVVTAVTSNIDGSHRDNEDTTIAAPRRASFKLKFVRTATLNELTKIRLWGFPTSWAHCSLYIYAR